MREDPDDRVIPPGVSRRNISLHITLVNHINNTAGVKWNFVQNNLNLLIYNYTQSETFGINLWIVKQTDANSVRR